jgi:hypothetical protein
LAILEDHGELKDRRSTEVGVEIVLDGVILKLLAKAFFEPPTFLSNVPFSHI